MRVKVNKGVMVGREMRAELLRFSGENLRMIGWDKGLSPCITLGPAMLRKRVLPIMPALLSRGGSSVLDIPVTFCHFLLKPKVNQ